MLAYNFSFQKKLKAFIEINILAGKLTFFFFVSNCEYPLKGWIFFLSQPFFLSIKNLF
ncbi:hypothetical protein DB42_BP00100 [Neochlamydia sp. EPS4]|nr:hypothetical protein DB42_BP00100 [Neochlamydia sp. EPS4]